MTFIDALLKKSNNLTAASKFQSLTGVIYLAMGAGLVVWPQQVQVLLRDPPFTGHEAALFRVIGMSVMGLGLHYYFGGRTGGEQMVAASLIERLIFVPLVCLPLAFAGAFPHALIFVTVLDMSLAVYSWILLRATPSHESLGQIGRA
jgi:hypothetical protein